MSSLYKADIGWPGGLQKIGVTISGPVDRVSITGPPWKISGGVPLAGSLARISAAFLTGQWPIAGTTPAETLSAGRGLDLRSAGVG